MAIQVGGTTVIDDSRNLTNVGGLKTVNSTSILGSGNIDASTPTTFGAVGTYTGGYITGGTTLNAGDTYAGSSIKIYTGTSSNQFERFTASGTSASGLSGTWRVMAPAQPNSSAYQAGTLWVRIS